MSIGLQILLIYNVFFISKSYYNIEFKSKRHFEFGGKRDKIKQQKRMFVSKKKVLWTQTGSKCCVCTNISFTLSLSKYLCAFATFRLLPFICNGLLRVLWKLSTERHTNWIQISRRVTRRLIRIQTDRRCYRDQQWQGLMKSLTYWCQTWNVDSSNFSLLKIHY